MVNNNNINFNNNLRMIYKFIYVTLLLLSSSIDSVKSEKNSTDDLISAETKDGKLEIIKQIKKVNDDGSYTIGYEADDGSFKIESRDVLGNIKGTYGYIDDRGDIKRVSYTSTNDSEIITKPELPSVVQRIPRINRTISSTTRRPIIIYPNLTTPSSISSSTTHRRNSVTTSSTTTTQKPPSLYLSTTSPVRILTSTRPIIRSTVAPQSETSKEGQLDRPDVYSRTKSTLLESDIKPVTEGTELKSNLLRRQLNTEKPFDSRQHLLNLQQGMGQDSVDVYSASVTTGTTRPLFTTTLRPKIISTPAPIIIRRYEDYRPPIQTIIGEQTEATTVPDIKYSTPSTVPIVQIPASKETSDVVPINHPFHRGAIFIPLQHYSHKNVVAPEGNVQYHSHYFVPKNEHQQLQPQPQHVPVLIRRPQPSSYLRPIPVQVDENGFIRELQQHVTVTPLPQPQKYTENPLPNPNLTYNNIPSIVRDEIDHIKPPVSTRDFQKILEHLIMRQSKLEQLSMLTRLPILNNYQPLPYGARKPLHFVPTKSHYIQAQSQTNHPIVIKPEDDRDVYDRHYYMTTAQSAYTPTRRFARLLTNKNVHDINNDNNDNNNDDDDEYLPADVREMLLLKMLQLAMNPALPLDADGILNESNMNNNNDDDDNINRKESVRNVEILGEVDDENLTTTIRNKREQH